MLTDLTNVQVQSFLEDYEKNVEIELLEGSKQSEILKIASARGIQLKNSRDLSGFKAVYTIAEITDANNQIVPKKKLLKVLPTLIGKPLNLLHQRKYVTGHYIDYNFNQKTNKVVAYGVFYRSNFAEEWETVKSFFKNGKLGMSSEIWSPKKSWKYNKDGSFVLGEMEFAGGALVYPPDEPAVKGADVLAIAIKNMDEQSDYDLIFATKYKSEEILICENGICKAVRGNGKGKNGEVQGDGGADVCVCPKCGYETKHKKGTPCNEIKCSKCKIKLIGKSKTNKSTIESEVPASEQVDKVVEKEIPAKETPKTEGVRVKCSNCGEELTPSEHGNTKCPKCRAVLDANGQMLYPPQIVDFSLTCPNPSCRINNWLIINRSDKKMKLRCLSCSKEFEIKFAKDSYEPAADVLEFVYSTNERCHQCGNNIPVSGVSTVPTRSVKCKKCGLEFEIEIGKSEKKKILSIKELIVELKPTENPEGEKIMSTKKDEKEVKVSTEEEEVVEETPTEEVVKEEKPVEETPAEEKPTEEVVEEEKPVEETPKEEEKPAEEAPVEEKKPEEVPAEEKPVEEVVKEEKAEEEVPEESVVSVDRLRVKNLIKTLRKERKEATDTTKKLEDKVELFTTNAKLIYERRLELGDAGKDVSDVDIVDEDKFKIAKYEKELGIKKGETTEDEVKKAVKKANKDNVAESTIGDLRKSIDDLDEAAEEINKKAFDYLEEKDEA